MSPNSAKLGLQIAHLGQNSAKISQVRSKIHKVHKYFPKGAYILLPPSHYSMFVEYTPVTFKYALVFIEKLQVNPSAYKSP